MDINYRIDDIEKKQTNNVAKQQENARYLQMMKYFLYSRHYNTNSIRTKFNLNVIPRDYIVILNYLYDKEIVEANKAYVAELDHIIQNDILRHEITEFKINNIK